jgi:probable phosphoglycerate mutase
MTVPERLFFVRHGESGWNVNGIAQGQSLSAPGLTQKGRTHADAVASSLVDLGVDLVVSSDLQRAVETARPIAIALGLPLAVDSRLRERSLGTIEGRPQIESPTYELGITNGIVTDPDARPKGGESVRELYNRLTDYVEELIASSLARHIVLVSHGGPLRVVRAYVQGTPLQDMPWHSVANGSVFKIAVRMDVDRVPNLTAIPQEVIAKHVAGFELHHR